ncbi:MAG: DUF4349 domain-containing protein [Erysipelotrichales bacterium]|nr:DUF4349 domain-containing protein [Erysipelotrichales bacterium]
MKRFLITLFIMCFMLCGCSANGSSAFDSQIMENEKTTVSNGSFGYDMGGKGDYDSSNDIFEEYSVEENRKLIKNYTYSLQTKEFDTFISLISSEVSSVGGYIQSSTISGNSYYHSGNRYASYIIRIPSVKANEFINKINDSEIAVVTRFNENVDDITTTYFDTEARIVALEKEEASLLNLMEKATTVEDIITIESKLSDVRYELESYLRQLKNYDLLVSYSTFTIDINEVDRVTHVEEKGMFDQIKERFLNSIEDISDFIFDLIVFVAGNIIYIVIYASIFAGFYTIFKKRIKTLKFNKKVVDKDKNM